jgi:hypothetical protein
MTVIKPRRPPHVYLAGKIRKYLKWRYEALGDVRFLDPNREWFDWGRGVYETQQALDPDFFVTAHDKSRSFPTVGPSIFILVGPFFVGCDHGCSHGLGMHAVASCNEGMELDVREIRNRVLAANLARIKRADFVFAHINERDCFGTLVEIGFARAAGIPVHLHFGDELDAGQRDDMWFAAHAADYRHEGVDMRTAFKNALQSRASGEPAAPRTVWDLMNPGGELPGPFEGGPFLPEEF